MRARKRDHRRQGTARALALMAGVWMALAACTPTPGPRVSATWTSVASFPGIALELKCPTRTSCYALGYDEAEASFGLHHWDGTSWERLTLERPPNEGWFMQHLSCPAADECYFAGSAAPAGEDPAFGRLLVVRWDGSTFTALPTDPAVRSYTMAISCPTAGYCMIVQNAFDGASVLIWDGEKLTPAPEPPLESLSKQLSCATPTMCILGLTARWNGSSWTTINWPAPNATLREVSDVTDISCPSPSFCVAIADGRQMLPTLRYPLGELFREQGLVTTFNGRTWSPFQALTAAAGQPNLPFDDLRHVSCSTPQWCVAYGHGSQTDTTDGTRPARTVIWTGSRWASGPLPPNDQPGNRVLSACAPGDPWCLIHSAEDDGRMRPPVPAAAITP